MLKNLLRLIMMAVAIYVGSLASLAQMSDEQVVAYVQQQLSLGKSQNQIGRELLAKGVTKEQFERIRSKYSGQMGGSGATSGAASNSAINGDRTRRIKTSTDLAIESDTIDVFESTLTMPVEGPELDIFGHDIFTSKELTFEPNQNLATPKDYRLGPGDMVYIDIWGESEDNITATISPEGSIIISQLGPVYLNGMTVDEANAHLRKIFGQKYAGFADRQSQVSLTLGEVRSILVNVMGEVQVPGTYRLSPFSSVFSALYNANGITDIGSIRNVQVMRGGKKVTTIDLYDYIFKGKQSDNVRLQEGDVIIVPATTRLVTVSGNVKRPKIYEMLPEETINDLLMYAGGFSSDAFSNMVTVERMNGKQNEMLNVPNSDFDEFTLVEGDVVTVGAINDRYENRVELRGAVMRPGFYAIDSNIKTVGDLLRNADGLLEDAFTNRAHLFRETDDLKLEIEPVEVLSILNGTKPDITLRRNDILVIYNNKEIEDYGTMSISGMVNNPGTFQFAANTSIEDIVMMAGGLQQGASLVRADVARRVIDPYSLKPTNEIAQIYSFSLKDGLVVNGDANFLLKPYDIVEIRRSPGYEPQQIVKVSGEVVFGGAYVLQKRGERISEVIKRCGGLTESAYPKGASLLRQMSEDEKIAREETMKLAKKNENGADSLSVDMLDISYEYSVGIDLEQALANPGSHYDIVLKEGDKIHVPETSTTVKVSGDVLYPNTVTFIPGKNYKFYVEQAGGYTERARKNKAFVVYMNGQVAKLKKSTKIEPGCQIIIPSKPENTGTDWTKVLSISSSVGSLATMAATIYSIFR